MIQESFFGKAYAQNLNQAHQVTKSALYFSTGHFSRSKVWDASANQVRLAGGKDRPEEGGRSRVLEVVGAFCDSDLQSLSSEPLFYLRRICLS